MNTIPKDDSSNIAGTRRKAMVTPEEEYEFWILLHQMVKAVTKVKENELMPAGVSPIQGGVLYLLKTAKTQLAPNQIARRLLRAPPTIHQLLDRMEAQGLVRRLRSAEGKRGVRVVMTEKGQEAYNKLKPRGAVSKILGKLSAKERKQLTRILGKLREEADRELTYRPSFL